MATVATVVSRLSAWIRVRYTDTYFIDWINDLLEELSGEPWMMKEIRTETGATVDNYRWVDPPSNCKELRDIFNPGAPDQKFQWEEVNGRIKIVGAEVEEATDPDTASTFTNYSTTYIDVDISDATEDEYKNSLFLITAGAYADVGYVIDSNDASVGGTCRLYFQHPLSTALDAAKVTAASLILPRYYVMLAYTAAYDVVSLSTDEIPIDDNYERRVTRAWLDWKVYQDIDPALPQSKAAEMKFRTVLRKIKQERRATTGGRRISPRYIPGLVQYRGGTHASLRYQEDI